MHIFDYSFLKNRTISPKVLNMSNSVYSLMTMSFVRKQDYSAVFSSLESVAKIQSVKSSNAIEGIVTSDDRIRDIINGNTTPRNHDEMEIVGYRDVLNDIHSNYANINFCENDILKMHKALLFASDGDFAGVYKQFDNAIIEVDQNGNRRIRFAPTSASETAQAMQQLTLAYLQASCDSEISQLLLIPCVILDFLCIHPFRDGNGRMSRLLSLLLLYKNGFDVGKYVSFEEQINKYKNSYYESLRESSLGWHENQNDYYPFIENFLSMLYICYKELDKRFAVVNSNKINKTKRIEATIKNSLTPISKADICQILPDVSPSTVESVLGKMMRDGTISKIGSARNTRYIYNN